MKQSKRKLTFRRFAYYLLVLAMVVSCIANGIFAKFTTQDDGGDGARVAKFGIVLNVSGDMFASSYNVYSATTDDEGNPVETINSNGPTTVKEVTPGDTISVQASYKLNDDGEKVYDNVVAPGTKGAEGLCISLSGTAETDLTITLEAEIETIALLGQTGTDLARVKHFGIMVPLKEGVIREDNFEEFKDELYTVTSTEIDADGEAVNTYTQVEEDAVFEDFEESEEITFYQIEDEVSTKDNYLPIKYKFTYKDGAEYKTKVFDLNKSFLYLGDSLVSNLNKLITDKDDNPVYDDMVSKIGNSETIDGRKANFMDFSHTTKFADWKTTSDVIETGTAIDKELYINWEWPFEVDGTKNSFDTILGHLASDPMSVVRCIDDENAKVFKDGPIDGEDYNLEIDFKINITVNQVD